MPSRNYRLVQGALLLALALVAQSLRLFIPLPPFFSIFIVGTLLNAVLLVATLATGRVAAVLIACIAPVVAFFQGQLPALPFVPLVAAGNAVYVLAVASLAVRYKYLGLLLAAALKTTLLFLGLSFLLSFLDLPPPLARAISFALGWPQFVTAFCGGLVGFGLLARLPKKNF